MELGFPLRVGANQRIVLKVIFIICSVCQSILFVSNLFHYLFPIYFIIVAKCFFLLLFPIICKETHKLTWKMMKWIQKISTLKFCFSAYFVRFIWTNNKMVEIITMASWKLSCWKLKTFGPLEQQRYKSKRNLKKNFFL